MQQNDLMNQIAKFCRVLSNIYMQQNDLMNHSSKGLTYVHDLYHIFFYISYVLTTCYMWCTNEIYYSLAKLS